MMAGKEAFYVNGDVAADQNTKKRHDDCPRLRRASLHSVANSDNFHDDLLGLH